MLVSALGAGCFVDAAGIPAETNISCATTEDCPPDWVCRPALGRCFKAAGLDEKPPLFLAPPVVEPARASLVPGHDRVSVHFSLDEDVGTVPPGLEVLVAGQAASCTKAEQDDGFAYTCGFTVTMEVPEGRAEVIVRALDAGGNLSEESTSVLVDRAPPVVQEINVVPVGGMVGRRQTLTVRVLVDEPLGGSPVLSDEEAGLLLALDEQGLAAGVMTFSHEVGEGDDGAIALTLSGVVDLAGNAAAPLPLDEIVLDATPPDFRTPLVLADPVLSPSAPSTTAQLTVRDALTPIVDLFLTVNGVPVDGCDALLLDEEGHLSCELSVEPAMLPSGLAEVENLPLLVTVSAVDAAGNASSTGTSMSWDSAPPSVEELITFVTPPPHTPVPAASALTNGSRLEGLMFVSESLGALPEISLVCDGESLTLEVEQGVSALTWQIAGTVSEAFLAEDGPCTLEGSLEDAVGNRWSGTLTTASVPLDRTAPSASAVVREERLLHFRAPWGSSLSSGVPALAIVGADVDLSGGLDAEPIPSDVVDDVDIAMLRVYPSEDVPYPIADLSAQAAGWQPAVLPFTDAREVWLSVVDSAGNESPDRVLLSQIELAASLGRKVAGSTSENPNRLEAHPVFPPPPNDRFSELDEADGVAHLDAEGATTRDGAALYDLTNSPPLDGALVFDENAGVLLHVEGRRVKRWTGFGWQSLSVSDPERDGDPDDAVGVFYDPFLRAVVALTSRHQYLWTGRSWQRRHFPQTDTSPPPRGFATFAYDPLRDVAVLFGGLPAGAALDLSNVQPLGDFWEWDRHEGWRELSTITLPSARAGAAMAYAPERGALVLHGGLGGADCAQVLPLVPTRLCKDTWAWDGDSWSPLPAGPTRALHAAVSGPDGLGILIAGGIGCLDLFSGRVTCDTAHTFTSTWTSAAAPGARGYHAALGYDARREELIYLPNREITCTTSSCSDAPIGRTYVDGVLRAGASGSLVQTSLTQANSAWLPGNGKLLHMHGAGDALDGWSFTPSSWSHTCASCVDVPTASLGVHVAAQNQTHAYVYTAGRIWSWSGQGQPTDLCDSPPCTDVSPSPDTQVLGFVSDGEGGAYLFAPMRVYYFKDQTWSTRCPPQSCFAQPILSSTTRFAYDAGLGRVVALVEAGSAPDRYYELWSFDGDRYWRECLSPECKDSMPPWRSNAQLAYDPVRERLALFGETHAYFELVDHERWVKREAAGLPLVGAAHGSVAYGGFLIVDTSGRLYGLETDRARRPGHVFRMLPSWTGIDEERFRIHRVGVMWHGGGAANNAIGSALYADVGAGFTLLSQSPQERDALSFAIENPAEAALFQRGGALTFALSTKEVEGTSSGEVFTDYVEVRARFVRTEPDSAPLGCGDGVLQMDEECDDGNVEDEDGCSARCLVERCGDGIIQSMLGEQCDDGNEMDGDGCSSTCTIEMLEPFFSEIVDHSDLSDARYVEIYNPAPNVLDLSGFKLERFANGSAVASIMSLTGVLPPQGILVIAQSAQAFEQAFGFAPDLASEGTVSGNGNDAYALVDPGGARIDVYGVIGVDGAGTPWDYTDSVATRKEGINAPNATWSADEWTIVPGAATATPGSHP